MEKLKLRNTKINLAIGVALATLCCVLGLKSTPVHAATGINKQINFQGKLVNTDGTNIADGTYNMQFKLYDASTSGSNLWTEEWLRNNSQGVTVTNGVFQVALGSITSLPGSVDFNTDNIYLTMNLGNTNASCTPFSGCSGDGEMSPRIRFTASPYSFNTDALDGLDSTNFVQLAQGLQTDSSTSNASIAINKTGGTANVITLQRGGSSVFTIDNSGLALFKPASGGDSTTAFQVQNAAGPTTVFDVDTSNKRIGINTTTPTADLSFGAGADRSINVVTQTSSNTAGNALSITAGAGNGNAAGGNLTITAGAAGASAAANAGGSVTIAGGAGTATDNNGGSVTLNGGTCTGTCTKGSVNLGASNTTRINLQATTLLTPASDSTSAFSVTTSGSSQALTVDTTNHATLIGSNATIDTGFTSSALTVSQDISAACTNSVCAAITGNGYTAATTTSLIGGNFQATTASGSYTVTNTYGVLIGNSTKGSSSTITNSYGEQIQAQTSGTNNYTLALQASSTQTLWVSSNANNTAANAGIAFGSSRDTNLYRSAADTLKTDDAFTVTGQLSVGASDTTGTLLVLDTKTDTGDPTGSNGGMYYNSNSGKFRCYENGSWDDCITHHKIVLGSDATDGTGNCTITDLTGLSFAVTNGNVSRFHANIIYNSAATTTGSGWAATGPANSYFGYTVVSALTTSTGFVAGGTGNDSFTCSASSVGTTTGNTAIIEGAIKPTTDGTLQLRFATEIAGSNIVAKIGSTLEWW